MTSTFSLTLTSQQLTQPSQLVGQLGQDYATQLTGLTSVPLDTSRFAPQVAGQDPLQQQAYNSITSGKTKKHLQPQTNYSHFHVTLYGSSFVMKDL